MREGEGETGMRLIAKYYYVQCIILWVKKVVGHR